MTLPLQHLAPNHSLFARFDPRWKIVSFLLLLIAIVMGRALPAVLTGFLISLLLVWLAKLPGNWYRVRIVALLFALLPFVIILPFTIQRGEILWEWGWLQLTSEGVRQAFILTLKSMSILSLVLVVLGTAPLHVTLLAARKLGVPGLFVHLAMMTYRYLFLLAQEFQRLRTALRVRGYRNRPNRHSYHTIGQVIGTLVVRGSDRAEGVAQAMRCRGFDGNFRCLHGFVTRKGDLLLFALFVAVSIGLILW